MATHETVLLTSVCKPFGEKHGDGFLTSYAGSHQILWAQHIFRPIATANQYGIDFIAANLATPTMTMHYPSMDRFIAELRRGYDYVGIAFVVPTMHKMVAMVEAVRRHAPRTKVVLGGYGTALPDEEIARYADTICRGEGVRFMRELLGESPEGPIVQPDIVERSKLFSVVPLEPMGIVIGGLGCPNGCDFCATSAYFRRRHIRFLADGDAVLDAIDSLRQKHPGLDEFYISDEDFLLNRKFGHSFLAAVRARDPRPFGLQIYASVKALSQYSVDELVEMGIEIIWVGYEAKDAGYAKMTGQPFGELLAQLQANGITVLTSAIIGYDYHTPRIIWREFDELMALRPSLCQFLIYGPAPGTPLWDRYLAAGRMLPEITADILGVGSRKADGASLTFHHPNIDAPQMEALQRRLYREEFARLGPSMYRIVEDLLNRGDAHQRHPVGRVRARAAIARRTAHRALLTLPGARRYLGPEVVQWLDRLEERLVAATGPMTRSELALSKAVSVLMRIEDLRSRYHRDGYQPATTTHAYRFDRAPGGAAARLRAVWQSS